MDSNLPANDWEMASPALHFMGQQLWFVIPKKDKPLYISYEVTEEDSRGTKIIDRLKQEPINPFEVVIEIHISNTGKDIFIKHEDGEIKHFWKPLDKLEYEDKDTDGDN